MNWPTPPALLWQAGPLPSLFEYLDVPRLSSVLLLVLATWLVVRYVTKLLEFFSERSPRARFLLKLAQPVIRVTLWTAALFVSFGILAPSREAFLAGVASVGLALGLGAQDLVKNFFSGIVMLVTRPFQMGDRVRIGGSYGEIDYIGLHSTKLTTPDDTRVTFPNSMVVSSQVFNANSGVPDCQVVTDLYLPPATDPQEAMRIGYEAAHTCPYLLLRKPVVVLLSDGIERRPFLLLRIKAYVVDHRFEPRMQSDITRRAKAEFLRLGMLDAWK